jgi:hypothetical protein
VLARRFGLLGYEAATLEDVGREIGLTRERPAWCLPDRCLSHRPGYPAALSRNHRLTAYQPTYEAATLEDVGREIGLTRERVRQIQVEGLRRLREILQTQPDAQTGAGVDLPSENPDVISHRRVRGAPA